VVGEAITLQPTWLGVGIVTGDVLSVSFVAGATIGIMAYEFGGDGHLSGRWTLAGDDETVYSETLTKLPDILPGPAAADSSEDQARVDSASCESLPVGSPLRPWLRRSGRSRSRQPGCRRNFNSRSESEIP
jgi:hypothetical protein